MISVAFTTIIAQTIVSKITRKNTVVSPNLLVLKYRGKAQFPYKFGRFAWIYAETVPFYKVFIPRN